MDEIALAKALVAKRAPKRWRSRCDHLRHIQASVLDHAHNFKQAIIALTSRNCPFALSEAARLAVIIVQPADLQPGVWNCTHQLHSSSTLALFDAGAIQPRIDIEKDADPSPP